MELSIGLFKPYFEYRGSVRKIKCFVYRYCKKSSEQIPMKPVSVILKDVPNSWIRNPVERKVVYWVKGSRVKDTSVGKFVHVDVFSEIPDVKGFTYDSEFGCWVGREICPLGGEIVCKAQNGAKFLRGISHSAYAVCRIESKKILSFDPKTMTVIVSVELLEEVTPKEDIEKQRLMGFRESSIHHKAAVSV